MQEMVSAGTNILCRVPDFRNARKIKGPENLDHGIAGMGFGPMGMPWTCPVMRLVAVVWDRETPCGNMAGMGER